MTTLKHFYRMAVAVMMGATVTACDDNDGGANEPDFIVDDPQDQEIGKNPWDYYWADGAIRRIEWLEDNYFVSSTKAEYITDEYLASRGITVKKRHREGTNEPNSLEVDTDANYVFIAIEPTESIRNVADMRRAIDNKEVYCAPVYYEGEQYYAWEKRLLAPTRILTVYCRDDVRVEFMKLFESYGGRIRARQGSYFKVMSPHDMTSIEFGNLLWESGMVVKSSIHLDRYYKINMGEIL